MRRRDDRLVTNESQPMMNEQDIRESKDSPDSEASPGKAMNEWFPDDFISLKKPVLGLSSPEAPSHHREISISPTNPRTYRSTSAEDSHNSRFALIILNQPIEMELNSFLDIWTRGITL